MQWLYNFFYQRNLDFFHQQNYADAWIERNIHDITVRNMWECGIVLVLLVIFVWTVIQSARELIDMNKD